jgi:hypothetical protein
MNEFLTARLPLIACIILLSTTAASLVPRFQPAGVVPGCIRLLLTVSSSLCGPTTGGSTASLGGGGRWLVCHLVIVHTHQLVNQVAELCRVAIHLVATRASHRRLLVFKLLLQDYRVLENKRLLLLDLRLAISSSLTGSFSKCFLLFFISFEICSIS